MPDTLGHSCPALCSECQARALRRLAVGLHDDEMVWVFWFEWEVWYDPRDGGVDVAVAYGAEQVL